MEHKVIRRKLKLYLDKVKALNFRKLKAAQREPLFAIKDKLFDIAACCCQLPALPCHSKYVFCNEENCTKQHLVCECPLQQKVPMEERAYLKDQRSKVGTKGAFQMGPVDRAAATKQARVEERREQKSDRQRNESLEKIEVNLNVSFEVKKNFVRSRYRYRISIIARHFSLELRQNLFSLKLAVLAMRLGLEADQLTTFEKLTTSS
jgi:hypothetical protein